MDIFSFHIHHDKSCRIPYLVGKVTGGFHTLVIVPHIVTGRVAGGKAEALEFLIKEDSHFAGIPLHDLNLRKNTLIGCIYRHGKVIIPSGQDKIMPGDSVLVVISGYRVNDIKEILEG